MQAGETEEEESKQQQRMKIMTDMTKKIKATERMDANSSWRASELLAAECKKSGFIQNGRIQCSDGTAGRTE